MAATTAINDYNGYQTGSLGARLRGDDVAFGIDGFVADSKAGSAMGLVGGIELTGRAGAYGLLGVGVLLLGFAIVAEPRTS